MNLTKAIEILDFNIKEVGAKMPPDTLIALKLGLEALKFTDTCRVTFDNLPVYRLPGETDEL